MSSFTLPFVGQGAVPSDRPTLFILIGPPGTGKTTWRQSYAACATRTTCVLSTDDQIEAYATAAGLTYSEAFPAVDFKVMEAVMFDSLRQAVALGADIIVDRTNMRRKSRRPFLEGVGPDYYKVAVMFEVEREELQRRLDHRAATTGKFIPPHVFDSMVASFEAPDVTEFHWAVKA